LSLNLRKNNISSFFTKIGTKLKLKTNIETKLNHFDVAQLWRDICKQILKTLKN